MKKLILSIFLTFVLFSVFSQDTIYYENFEGNFNWYVSESSQDSFINIFWNDKDSLLAIEGEQSLWVTTSNDSGMTWQIGYADIYTWIYAWQEFDFSDSKNLQLSFRWKCDGDWSDFGKVAIVYDYMIYEFQEGGNNDYGIYNFQPNDTIQCLNIPDSLIGDTNFNGILFLWENDDTWNTGLPFTIDELTITANNKSKANFEGYPNNVFVGHDVDFKDLSSMNPNSWQWYFEGAIPSTSTDQNPSGIVYSDTGYYDVKLIVSNGNSYDTLLKKNFIHSTNCSGMPLRLEILTDDYGGETFWEITDITKKKIYDYIKPYTYESNTLYVNDICVPNNDELYFTMHDDYGDGMCCEYGKGYYKLTSYCHLIAQGGDFGSTKNYKLNTYRERFHNNVFLRNYIWGGQELTYDMIQSCEGNYVLTGYTDSYGKGRTDGMLTKIDQKGDTIWTKTYGSDRHDVLFAVMQNEEGGYTATGMKYAGRDNSNLYILKTTTNGDLVWEKSVKIGIDQKELSFGSSIIETDNQSFLVSGYANDPNWDTTLTFIAKFDKDGNEEWINYYADENWESPSDFDVYDSNYYFINGTTIRSIDKDGTLLKQIEIDTFYSLYPSSTSLEWIEDGSTKSNKLQLSENGDIFVIGHFGYDYDWNDFYDTTIIIKLDNSGNYDWDKVYPNFNYFTSTISSDNLYLIGSDTSYNLVLKKIDKDGNELWQNIFNLDDWSNLPTNIMITEDNGIMITGGLEYKNFFLIKLDSSGNGCFSEPYQDEVICLVTVDDSTGKNLITWNRTDNVNTESYNIYKETDISNEYELIGNIPFTAPSYFVDSLSFPKARSYRYKISVIDTCNKESDLSPFHKTMHLTANKGIAGEVNLIWEHYEGFEYNSYKIFRGTKPDSLYLIASIPNTLSTYSDINPPKEDFLFYQVLVVKNDTCFPNIFRSQNSSGPFSQSYSNLKDYSVNAAKYIFPYPGEVYFGYNDTLEEIIEVYTNVSDWQVSTNANWVTLKQNKEEKEVYIEVEPSDIERSAIIEFSSTDAGTKYINIYQGQQIPNSISNLNFEENMFIHPNPYQNSTNIYYQLNNQANVSIHVYNSCGEIICTLADGIEQKQGSYNYSFSAKNKGFSSGLYFIRFQINDQTIIKKIIEMD